MTPTALMAWAKHTVAIHGMSKDDHAVIPRITISGGERYPDVTIGELRAWVKADADGTVEIPIVFTSAPGSLARIVELENAIRAHRSQKGHDRCWLDDVDLYAILRDGVAPDGSLPPCDEFLAGCAHYYAARSSGTSHDHLSLAEVLKENAALAKELEALNTRNAEADDEISALTSRLAAHRDGATMAIEKLRAVGFDVSDGMLRAIDDAIAQAMKARNGG